jgi:hypothetical protein
MLRQFFYKMNSCRNFSQNENLQAPFAELKFADTSVECKFADTFFAE